VLWKQWRLPTADERLTSIVLPVHNQGDHIRGIVEGYLGALERVAGGFEVILVPNASTDSSNDVCDALAERFAEVRSVPLAVGGWGRAVRMGLADARGDILCYTNSARTTPQMLTLMLAYERAYPQVVLKANRRIRDSWRRRLGSVLYNLECRALFDLSTWDINGTPKVFPRAFDRLLSLTRDDDLIDVEFLVECKENDYPVIEVPLLATVRHGGRSTTSYASAARMYWGAYRMARDRVR
jgi:glycosyltransferase involved in cell wall biosynthesis